MSKTSAGMWAGLDPPEVGTLDDDGAIGDVVERALLKSIPGRPHPSAGQRKYLWDQLLRAVGVRSTSQFYRTAALVRVERVDDRYVVSRRVKELERGTSRLGYGGPADSHDLLNPTPVELGSTIRQLALLQEEVETYSRAR